MFMMAEMHKQKKDENQILMRDYVRLRIVSRHLI